MIEWLRRFIRRKPERAVVADKLVHGWTVIDANPLAPLLQRGGTQATLKLFREFQGICTVPILAKVKVRLGQMEWWCEKRPRPDDPTRTIGTVACFDVIKCTQSAGFGVCWDANGRVEGLYCPSRPWEDLSSPAHREEVIMTTCFLFLMGFCHTPSGDDSLKLNTPEKLSATDLQNDCVGYSTLTIGEKDLAMALAFQKRHPNRLPPMLHWVRCHERRIGETTTLVRQHLRGDPGRGFHFKDYRLGPNG